MESSIETGPRLDVATVRSQFPALQDGAAHFESPGGTQTPEPVGRAMYETLTGPLANRGTQTTAQRNADHAVASCRAAMADLLGGAADGMIFGRSSTQNTMDMARAIAKTWNAGDEVVVTRLDHDANVRPWVIAAQARDAIVRFADFDPATGELDPRHIEQVLSERTKVVAVTGASNLIGTMPDLPAIAALTHAAGAWLYVDGVHHAAHTFVDVAELGADFYACSPYKFLGPHCGVLYGRPEVLERIAPDKLLPSTDAVPERFELGTLPYELMAGTTAAVDFLAGLTPAPGSRRDRLRAAMTAVGAHEDRLRTRVEQALARLPGCTVHSRAGRRTPTLLATFEGHDTTEVAAFLAGRGVNAPAHHFYAPEASRRLGLGEAGGLRIGLAPYNDDADVDRLLDGLDAYLGR